MADTSVEITAGTGTNIDTRTEGTNGNHRQVIVIGDPATNAGVAPVDATAGLKVDLGADNDITGTVTANLSATDNAVLDTIDAVLDTINAKLVTGTVIGDVNLGATDNAVLDSIKSDTAALVIDAAASEVLLGTIDADTGAIKTAVEALDNAVDGNYLNVNLNIAGTDVGAGAAAVPISDGGNAITVDGTVTANLSATDNAVLDTIDAVLDTINAKLVTGTVIGDVNLGATDNAVLDTIDAVLDTIKTDTAAIVTDAAAIEVLLGTIDADTGAIKTAVEVIDNAISGSEMQVDVVSLPAVDLGANNDVTISSGKTILRAVISAASSGDNTLVAAVADKKIKVLSVCLVATAAVTVRFESGASGTALSGVISLDAKSGFILNAPADPNMHWFETGVNTLLNLELGGAVQVSGMMTYYTEA